MIKIFKMSLYAPSQDTPLAPFVRLRFAPSPTGFLHLGNLRTALFNWLFCKKHQGTFILRIDDTDAQRNQEIYIQDIQSQLTWMGLVWDEMYQQSHRSAFYHQAAEVLKTTKRLYPCYENADELQAYRNHCLEKGLPPLYRKEYFESCLPSAAYEREPYWRFALIPQQEPWEDLLQGPQNYLPQHLSDPVLIRADSSASYTLSSVVDDGEMKITHIIRGADHLTNTTVQIQLFKALGYPLPQFAHFPLLMSHSGEKFSKRSGADSIKDLRNKNFLPLPISQSLMNLGVSGADKRRYLHLKNMAECFDLGAYSRSNVIYDPETLLRLQQEEIHQWSYEDLCHHWGTVGNPDWWKVIQNNITDLKEIPQWDIVFHDEQWNPLEHFDISKHPSVSFSLEDLKNLGKIALETLPSLFSDSEFWPLWLQDLREKLQGSQWQKKHILLGLRILLTGHLRGPSLHDFCAYLGREMVRKRLLCSLSFS